MNITVPTSAIAGLLTEGILVIAIPVILLIVWKKKTKASLKPAVAGMIIFPLFGILLKAIPGYFLLMADNPVSRVLNSNIWLYSIIGGGLLAGIFEEGGRFVAFKFFLKKYRSNKDAISYGIGHGGFESAYMGLAAFNYVILALTVNAAGMGVLTAGLDEANTAAVTAQIQSIAATPFYVPAVLGVVERISAIVFHISMSVLDLAAAREKKYLPLFPLAILLHTLMNSMIGFVLAGMISTIALECMLAAYSAVMAFFAYRLYKKPDEEEKAVVNEQLTVDS
ncbi:MAG: YhfC family intramembrane metalloprotease [Oscillospiraceae bacterium]|nr:YhfC family intramembrane metalloprotease [Oscillospiraceae bacterium]